MIINKKLIYLALIIVTLAAIGLYFSFKSPQKTIEVSKGEVNKIETMVQLCAVDLYSEVPILDTINSKVMFAVQKQKGSVSFDLENIQIDAEGDTVRIILPPEIVELYEATENNSWEVIDTKAIGPLAIFKSDKFSIEEENALKSKIKNKSLQHLYQNGTIRRARAEGAHNLQILMEKVYQKPVRVTDPTPKGAHYREFK